MSSETDDGRDAPRDVSRRNLFKQVGLVGAAAAFATPPAVDTAAAQTPTSVVAPTREALETLTAAEADMLEAMVARLIPSDENGPGAAEARAAHYIDRALVGPLRFSRGAYAAGLDALDAYAQSIKGAPFTKMSAQDQDAVLTDMEKNVATGFSPNASTFFNLVQSTIPKAVNTGRLKVVTQAIVTSVELDEKSGRVSGVTYVKGGVEYFQPADVVLLASYTYENVRIMLLSKSKPFPNGLSNNGGQVGKHYFSHHTGAPVAALFPHDLNNWYGLPAQGTAVDNWADDNFDHSGLDFIGGGNLWVYSDRRPIGAASMSTFGKAPVWGSAWKSFIKQNADRWNVAYLQKTTLPYEDNYLDLDPAAKDGLGFPVIRITADHKDNEKRIGAFIQDKMAQWFMEAGAIAVEKGPMGTMGPSTHAYGGTRMGDNRETNVVNRWGFSHEVPNLGILGASVMGTSGAHNPTLTAQALAWRTADHLTKNWKAIAGG